MKLAIDYLQFIVLLSSAGFKKNSSETACYDNEEGNHFKPAQTDQKRLLSVFCFVFLSSFKGREICEGSGYRYRDKSRQATRAKYGKKILHAICEPYG